MKTLYELAIEYPMKVEIIEHKFCNHCETFEDGEFVKINAVFGQQRMVSDMAILPDADAIFKIGARGYFDANGKYIDMFDCGQDSLDFRNELHFYSINKDTCYKVLENFKTVLEKLRKNADDMIDTINIFEKED